MPPTWPSQGHISFDQVYLRYAPDEDPVLKNLNINIESGWKVCICSYVKAKIQCYKILLQCSSYVAPDFSNLTLVRKICI